LAEPTAIDGKRGRRKAAAAKIEPEDAEPLAVAF